MWSTEKFPIDTCPPKHKKPPSLERRRKSAQRESLAFGCISMATPLEPIICPLELAGESYRRVWGDYLCSSPMVSQLCSASSAPSLNGFRLLTSASFFTSSCVDFQSINHVARFLPVPATIRSPVERCPCGSALAAQASAIHTATTETYRRETLSTVVLLSGLGGLGVEPCANPIKIGTNGSQSRRIIRSKCVQVSFVVPARYVIIRHTHRKLSCFGCRFWAFSAYKGVCPTYVAIWLGSQPASNPHYTWISIFGKFQKKRGRGFGAVKPP